MINRIVHLGLMSTLLAVGLFGNGDAVEAQVPPVAVGDIRSTTVQVELLSRSEGAAVHAQEWGRYFEKLDVNMVMRRGLLEDKPEIDEQVRGTLRTVTLVGLLERDGEIRFPGKSFRRADGQALQEWIEELQTYGAQGSPTGKPLWGLSQQQFETIFAALSKPVKIKTAGKTLPSAIESLAIPPELPLRWSDAAENRYQTLGTESTARQSVLGLTAGTALAITLNDRGFGFRPNRTPTSELELVVELLNDDPLSRWPIGWPTQKQVPLLLPGMFDMRNISIQRQPLDEVIQAALIATKCPILVDYSAIEQSDVELTKLRLNFPLKKTTWSLALRGALVPQKLNREYWQDEAGQGFVWISPIGQSRRAVSDSAGQSDR